VEKTTLASWWYKYPDERTSKIIVILQANQSEKWGALQILSSTIFTAFSSRSHRVGQVPSTAPAIGLVVSTLPDNAVGHHKISILLSLLTA
jgi:hypothetical protein